MAIDSLFYNQQGQKETKRFALQLPSALGQLTIVDYFCNQCKGNYFYIGTLNSRRILRKGQAFCLEAWEMYNYFTGSQRKTSASLATAASSARVKPSVPPCSFGVYSLRAKQGTHTGRPVALPTPRQLICLFLDAYPTAIQWESRGAVLIEIC